MKNLPAHLGDAGEAGFDSWVRKIPWSRKGQPTPVCLLGKFHGQRGLVSYSPWGCKRVRHDLATKQQRCLKDMESGVKRIVQIHTVSIEQKSLDLYPFSLHHLVSPVCLAPVQSYCPSCVAPLSYD